MASLDPMPQQDPIADKSTGFATGRWLQWLYNAITVRLGLAAYRTGFVQLTNQLAAIATTPINGTIAGGRSRVQWYLRVNTGDPAATLQFQLTWTESGTVLNTTSAVITNPPAGTVITGMAYLETDANAPVSYAVLYSHLGGPIAYRLTIAVEVMP